MSDKKQWGGIRQGSGRPPTLKNPVRVTIWLEADELDWIKSQGKQGEVTRQLIETAINQLYEIERTKRMNIQALTEAVSRAVAKMETDGIIGWGLETFDNELFEKVEMSPASGCTTSNCAHNSHDPAAPTVKLITRHGEKIVNLGSENESDGYTEWYAVIGDNEPRFFRLNDSQAYWAKLWEIDVNGVPDWALAKLAKN